MPAIDSSKCDCMLVDLHRADHRAEALDGADARRATEIVGSRTPSRSRYFVCATFGNDLGPQLERRVEDLGAELLAVRLLPRLDRGHAVAGARRHVLAVRVESAVAAHAAGDERLGDVVTGEELGLGPRELDINHRGECRS